MEIGHMDFGENERLVGSKIMISVKLEKDILS
jgi:hypothetical protein